MYALAVQLAYLVGRLIIDLLRNTHPNQQSSGKTSFDGCYAAEAKGRDIVYSAFQRNNSPPLAALGRSIQHSVLPLWKSHGLSRPAASDPNRTLGSEWLLIQ
jgi:hypothetical protein